MATRLIEVILPEDIGENIPEQVKEHNVQLVWRQRLQGGEYLTRLLLPAEETEHVLDVLQKNYGSLEGFKAVVMAVEASLPRPETKEEEDTPEAPAEAEAGPSGQHQRISREELHEDVADAAEFTPVFAAMIVLAAIVAAIGIMRDSVSIIIGAMVIAPLLGPNMALSLATTLGDLDLSRNALKTLLLGVAIAIGLSSLMGLFIKVDPGTPELVSRTVVGLGDIALALCAGTAGALAFTKGVPSALVGVMVAVALLPPLVASGLLLGGGRLYPAWQAFLLFWANLVCVNLAGVMTFRVQGIRPLDWWDADRAKKATVHAMILWVALLLILVASMILLKKS